MIRKLTNDSVSACIWTIPGIYGSGRREMAYFSLILKTGRSRISLQFSTTRTALHGEWLSSIYGDQSGAIWLCSLSDGISRLDPTSARFETYQMFPHDPNSLSVGGIWSFLRDSTGTFWVGSVPGGLDKLDPVTGKYKHYRHNPTDPTTISDNNVFVMIEDSANTLWIGTQRGLNRFDPKSERFTRYTHDPANPPA